MSDRPSDEVIEVDGEDTFDAALDAAVVNLLSSAWPPTGKGKGGDRARVLPEDLRALRLAWNAWRNERG